MHITGLVDELSKFFDVASMPKPHVQAMHVQGKTRSAAAPAVTTMRFTLNKYLGLLLCKGHGPPFCRWWTVTQGSSVLNSCMNSSRRACDPLLRSNAVRCPGCAP